MQKALVRILLFLLRKVSKQEWEKSEEAKTTSDLEEKTLITIDGDAPGVTMKIFYPNNKSFKLLEQIREEFLNSDTKL